MGKKSNKRDHSPLVERLQKAKEIQEKLNKKSEKVLLLDSGDNDINPSVSKDSGKL